MAVLNLNDIATYGLTVSYIQQGFLGLLACNWPGTALTGMYPTAPGNIYGNEGTITYQQAPYQSSGQILYSDFMDGSVSLSTAQNVQNLYEASLSLNPGFSWFAAERYAIFSNQPVDWYWSPYAYFTTTPDTSTIVVNAPTSVIDLSNSIVTSQADNVATSQHTNFVFLPGVSQPISLAYSVGTSTATTVVSGWTNSNSTTTTVGSYLKGGVGVPGLADATAQASVSEAWGDVYSLNYSTSQANTSSNNSIITLGFDAGSAVPNANGEYSYTNADGETFTLVPNTQYEVLIQISTTSLITPIPNQVTIKSPTLYLKDNLYGTDKGQNEIFMDITKATQQALYFGYNTINPDLVQGQTLGEGSTNIAFTSNPDTIQYYGLVDGTSNTSYDATIAIKLAPTSQSLQEPTASNLELNGSSGPSLSAALKSGILDLLAIAKHLHADKGMVIDVSYLWKDPSLIPELLTISGGVGHVIRTGNHDAILSDISDSTFFGSGNVAANLTANSNENSLYFGNGNVTVNLNGAGNNLFFDSGCNFVKVGSVSKNYIVLDNSQGFNYVEIDNLSGNTIISNWNGSKDFLTFGDSVDRSSLSINFDPKSYTYAISVGSNKVATIVASARDNKLESNISDDLLSITHLKSTELSDYSLINALYGKFLDRAPDHGGLGYWVNAFASGRTASEIGKSFILSEEYGNHFTDTKSFVEALYHDVFGRSADSGGLQYWSSKIGSGMTKIDLVGHFLASPEALGGNTLL